MTTRLETTTEWESYSNIITNNVFDCITPTSRVLEVGPFNGWFSDLILQKSPCYLELVESNSDAIELLTQKYKDNPVVKITHADIFDVVKNFTNQSFDVVVAFGVLYHWHNPLEFLEQISNHIDPKYVCIDNIDVPNLYIANEDLNAGGSRNIVTLKKTTNLSLTLPKEIIHKAMTNLGYRQVYFRSMSDIKLLNKEKFNVWKFENK
jgi:SAM-dependent methyltransferase